MRRHIVILVLAVAVLVGGLFCGQAQAQNAHVFTITGGTAEQQQLVRGALEDSSWDWASFGGAETQLTLTPEHPPYWGEEVGGWYRAASNEIPFTLEVAQSTVGVAYWPSGRIYIDSRITDPALLREVAMHESAHSRVMFVWFWSKPTGTSSIYECYALEAWRDLIGAEGDLNNWYMNPVESHAEWFRVTYLDPALQYYAQPRTQLPAPPGGTADVAAFHAQWCQPQVPSVPWSDIPTDDQELVVASNWAYEEGIFQGYGDGTFGVYDPMLRRHVALVAERVGLTPPDWFNDYSVATRGDVAAGIPGLTWFEERWDESITRSQVLRLMYRARDGLGIEAQIAQSLEQWFADTTVTWRGATRQPRLARHAGLLVQLSRQYDVPLWLALGQAWRESQWGTTDPAASHNCIWGVKDTAGKWGKIRGTVSGFADYVSVEECCRAYFRLMDGAYRHFIDARDWRGLLNRYAPAYQNDTRQHYRTVMAVRQWCEERGIE